LRFLADVGVSGATVRAIRDLGHDAAHLVELGLERLTDADILARATQEKGDVALDLAAAGDGQGGMR
jgi:hypothetical protein